MPLVGSNLTVREVKTRRKALATTLKEAIQAFEEETGVYVDYISAQRGNSGSRDFLVDREGPVTGVEISLRLDF